MKTQRGSLSAITVCLVLAGVSTAGLVFDGGAAINQYQRLSDLAENAARAGAQEIVGVREGNIHIDSRAAGETSRRYLQFFGTAGEVQVSTNSVTVEISAVVTPQILGLFGLHGRRIHVLRTARIVSG